MAAIAYPGADRRPQAPSRRHLTLVPPPARSRSAIYWRRRALVLVDRLSAEHGGAPLQPGEQLALH